MKKIQASFLCLQRGTISNSRYNSLHESMLLTSETFGRAPELDYYAKDGGPGEVTLLCSFYNKPLHTSIKTNVNKLAISNHMTLNLRIQALRRYLKQACEYETHTSQHTNVSAAKDHEGQTAPVLPSLA